MKHILLIAFLGLSAQSAFCQSKGNTADTTATSATAFRMHYDDLFRHNVDNSVSPIRLLLINGALINTATKIADGEKYGGIVLSLYYGHDALVDTQKSVVIIRKFLK